MEIAVKSETDSRVLVYPMAKALSLYGTVAIYTSNRMMSRLIENELEGGFKNIRIVVSPEADLELVKESDEYIPGKYDYLIYDNIGATDYDILLAIVTSRLSESYTFDLISLASDEKTKIVKFGSPAPAIKEKKPKEDKKSKGSTKEEEPEEPVAEEESDENFNKWKTEKTDEEIFQELINDNSTSWVKFPSFDEIELMESRHNMMCPSDPLIKELYKLFGEHIAVDLRQFTKGARLKDESGSDISGTDVR